MRLIDADALLDAISVHLERIEQEIDDAPTIDTTPIIEESVYLNTEEVANMVIEKLARQRCIMDGGKNENSENSAR